MVTVPPVNVDWTVDYTVAHSQAPRRASTRREFNKVQVAHPRWDLASEIMSAKTKVTKTKTALKQETYNLSDLKHDLQCGFVELGGSVSVSS
jgi:hypothetical protein